MHTDPSPSDDYALTRAVFPWQRRTWLHTLGSFVWLTTAAYVWNAGFQHLAATAAPLRTSWQIAGLLVPPVVLLVSALPRVPGRRMALPGDQPALHSPVRHQPGRSHGMARARHQSRRRHPGKHARRSRGRHPRRHASCACRNRPVRASRRRPLRAGHATPGTATTGGLAGARRLRPMGHPRLQCLLAVAHRRKTVSSTRSCALPTSPDKNREIGCCPGHSKDGKAYQERHECHLSPSHQPRTRRHCKDRDQHVRFAHGIEQSGPVQEMDTSCPQTGQVCPGSLRGRACRQIPAA